MDSSYDLVVLGGGAAGLTAAGLGAGFGARTLLVEKDRLGGDCTWTGCVPSKALLKSAHDAHDGSALGTPPSADHERFARAMRRARAIRQAIYEEADAPENMEALGVDVRSGRAKLAGPHAVAIESSESSGSEAPSVVEARYVVLATGGRPAAPPIDGLEAAGYLTNETLFELEEQPEHLAVLGAGPIGTEMAQAFRRLGSRVTVVEQAGRLLQHDHPRLAAMLRDALEEEGVEYCFDAAVERVERAGEGQTTVHYVQDDEPHALTVDALLVATGRRPNVEGLGLEAAGVDYDEGGITADDRCRTSQRHIYAAGDVTGRYQFTHMSEHMAKVAAMNALLKVPQKIDAGRVPWVTYTDPELAHVGKTEKQLREEGTRYEVYRFPLDRLDRAVCEGRARGEIRVYATAWTGKIRGASVLAPRAGELIGTVAVAMKAGASLAKISDTIFPYPTYGQGVRRAADQWYARKQKPWLVRGIQKVFGYEGPVIEPDPDRIV